MDRHELVSALRRAEVPDAFYRIPGIHDTGVRPDACYVLYGQPGCWTVALEERGTEEVLGRHRTEDAACRRLLAALLAALPAAGRTPAAEGGAIPAEVLRRSAGIQRRAWEQFRRARGPATGEAPEQEP